MINSNQIIDNIIRAEEIAGILAIINILEYYSTILKILEFVTGGAIISSY